MMRNPKGRLNLLNLLVIMAILLGLAGSATPVQGTPVRIQPVLKELALSEPDARLRVIIQKSGPGDEAERLVAALGGEILNELELLNAFSARIEAAKLARLGEDASVAWVTLDAPVSAADSGSSSPHITLRAEFNQSDYNADSASWGAGWSEVGEDDGPHAGQVAIEDFFAGIYQGVRLMGAGVGLQTSVDLSTAQEVLLSLEFRRKDFGPEDVVQIEASLDGDVWSTLDHIQGSGSDAELIPAQVDLSPFQGQPLMLRISSALHPQARMYIDYVQIDYLTSPKETPVFENRVLLPLVVQTDQQATPYTLNGATSMDALYSTGTVLDEFNSISYANNDGLVPWSGEWVEDDAAGSGPSGGHIRIEYNNYYGSELRLENNPDSAAQPAVWRRLDLTAGVTGAVLSFDFRTVNAEALQDQVLIQVSGDDGQTYHTLEVIETYSGSVRGSRRYDISAYTGGGTRLRFMVKGGYTDPYEYFFIDNVQVAYTTNGANEVRDEFHSRSYTGEDGIGTWRAPWVEYDPYGGYGPYGGYVFVNSERLGFHYLYGSCEYIQRAANLHGATNATLSFDWDTRGLQSKYNISVLVSSDGGANFSVLDTFVGGGSGEASYDLTPFISSNTVVRFQDRGTNWVYGEYAYFDNIQISYSSPCPECIDYSNLENAFTPAVNANKLWNEPPYIQGQGVTVAVVDSGVAEHIDFKDASGASRILTHISFATGSQLPDDFYGHGTHVAGLIAANGAMSGNEYMGIAPKANLVDVKVLDDMGRGFTSEVVDGLEWIFNNAAQYNIRVVNLSLNSADTESYRTSALSAALELLWFKGITVVVAAGNNGGSQPGILYPPANDPYLIAVGATDDQETATISDDTLASFSSFGETAEGYSRPDLVAPGTDLTSLLASDSNLVIEHPEKVTKDKKGNNFFQMSGTSMASPLVAGAVALLLQAEPGLTPDQVKARLIETARPFNAGNGAGYVDVYAAVHTQTPAAPPQAYIPNGLPAQMALIAYWAGTVNDGDNVDWTSINWDTIDWSSVNWGSVNWGSVNWGSVNWGSVNWGSVNWGSVNWGSVNWGSVNWGSVNWGSVNWGSVNWGSVNWGSTYWSD
jgi:serine protease AprX